MRENWGEIIPASGYSLRGVQGRIIDSLGRAIVGGQYAPGQLLPKETELITAYGVSRTSLREAMKVLATKGLVEIRQKSGTRVRAEALWNVFDSDLVIWMIEEGRGEAIIRDLVELRQIVEPAAARLAASRVTMSDLKLIDLAQQGMRANVRDPGKYADSDVDFHMAIFGASHNLLLRRFGYLVADFLQLSFRIQQQATVVGDDIPDLRHDVEQHAKIYDAINRSLPDEAARAMLEAVLEAKRNLIDAVETLESRS